MAHRSLALTVSYSQQGAEEAEANGSGSTCARSGGSAACLAARLIPYECGKPTQPDGGKRRWPRNGFSAHEPNDWHDGTGHECGCPPSAGAVAKGEDGGRPQAGRDDACAARHARCAGSGLSCAVLFVDEILLYNTLSRIVRAFPVCFATACRNMPLDGALCTEDQQARVGTWVLRIFPAGNLCRPRVSRTIIKRNPQQC